jgi:hypothetical protein
MALKLKQSISKSQHGVKSSPLANVPVFYRVELERHREHETVRARLERVEARAKARARES